MFLYEQRAGECGKEELLVHKKTPPAEPGSATHMTGWECGKREQRSAPSSLAPVEWGIEVLSSAVTSQSSRENFCDMFVWDISRVVTDSSPDA